MSSTYGIRLVRLLALSALLVGTLQAENTNQGPKGDRKARMMKRFDIDGDGQLSEAEKKEAKAAHKKNKSRIMKRFDADGNGKLSDAEKAVAKAKHQERRNKVMKKFDADGNGKLDPSEREAHKKARAERRERKRNLEDS